MGSGQLPLIMAGYEDRIRIASLLVHERSAVFAVTDDDKLSQYRDERG